jgi:hypothetical protein
MSRLMRFMILAALHLAAVPPADAQTSAGYRMNEQALNAGGRPAGGLIASSPGFRMTIDSIGASVGDVGLSSTSFKMRPGLVPAAIAPGEVRNLRFSDATTLVWDPDASTGVYNIYRAETAALPGTFGSCHQPGVPMTQAVEPAQPPPGVGWFYFVTAENPLAEEGTKGFTSAGAERGNPAPCP